MNSSHDKQMPYDDDINEDGTIKTIMLNRDGMIAKTARIKMSMGWSVYMPLFAKANGYLRGRGLEPITHADVRLAVKRNWHYAFMDLHHLYPAIKYQETVVRGKGGASYQDIIEANSLPTNSSELQMGFVTFGGKYLNSADAFKWLQVNDVYAFRCYCDVPRFISLSHPDVQKIRNGVLDLDAYYEAVRKVYGENEI